MRHAGAAARVAGYTSVSLLLLGTAGTLAALAAVDWGWWLFTLVVVVFAFMMGLLRRWDRGMMRAFSMAKLYLEVTPAEPRLGHELRVHLRLVAKQRIHFVSADVTVSCMRQWSKRARPETSWIERMDHPYSKEEAVTAEGWLDPGQTWEADVVLKLPVDAPVSGKTDEGEVTWHVTAQAHLAGTIWGATAAQVLKVGPRKEPAGRLDETA